MFAQPPTESILETYLQPWKKFVQFSGRAPRREYWTFTLINFAISIVLLVASAVLGGSDPSGRPGPVFLLIQLIYTVFSIATIIPGLAVAVRRLHDTNRSGWWLLLCMICGIILLVFGLQEGDRGPNDYGPDPYGYGDPDPWRLTPPMPDVYSDLNTQRPMETWRTRDDESSLE